MIRRGFLLAIVLFFAGCERPTDSAVTPDVRHEPVVVYASYEDEEYLPALFTSFTEATGIPVTVRHKREEQIIAEVIENRGSPPADVLLTRSVHGVWQAADEGALRPLQSDRATELVPEWLRDPDGYWTATGFSTIVVLFDPKVMDPPVIQAFNDLGNPEFESGLCLSAPWNATNRNLVATLIATESVRPAEMIVRSWVANLALPAFDSEQDLVDAVAAGRCALGIVTARSAKAAQDRGLDFVRPDPLHFVVEAAGIGRHARYPDSARALVDWIVDTTAQRAHSETPGFYPANQALLQELAGGLELSYPDVGVAGAYDVDAIKLAERAGWR